MIIDCKIRDDRKWWQRSSIFKKGETYEIKKNK